MWQSIHTSFVFKLIPLEKKWGDDQRRQGVTTHIPSSQALFSCVYNYGNSCKLPAFPANAFVLKKTDQPGIRTQKTKKNCLLSGLVCSLSPPAEGEREFSLGRNRITIWPLKWQKKNKKQKYLHEAFSKGCNVMPSLTVMSLKKISQQLHSLPFATDCLVSGSVKSGPNYLFPTLSKINFTELSLIGCLVHFVFSWKDTFFPEQNIQDPHTGIHSKPIIWVRFIVLLLFTSHIFRLITHYVCIFLYGSKGEKKSKIHIWLTVDPTVWSWQGTYWIY